MSAPYPNRVERRAAQRFEVNLPVAIEFEGQTARGFTQDLSGRGVFFYTEAGLPIGATVELTFTMPSEVTLSESMPVRAHCRVLRSAPAQGGRGNGIAVQIDSFQYLPAGQRDAAVQVMRVSPTQGGSSTHPASQ